MIEPQTLPSFRPPLYASPQRLINGELPPTMGYEVAAWQERWLVHGEGDMKGRPRRLAPHQLYVLLRALEYDPADGHLLYDRVVVGMPKGCSKTEDAAAYGLGELYGPVRPLRSPNVVVQAASYDQANAVYGAAKDMIEDGPLASRFQTFDNQLYPFVGGGIMRRRAARADTSEGGLPTCAIGDELHEWKCLSLGTEIAMADGTLRAVEHVEVGDEVVAWDEASDRLVSAVVTASRANGVREMIEVVTRRGRRITTTTNHPFFVERTIGVEAHGGAAITETAWVEAADLRLTDRAKVALRFRRDCEFPEDTAYLVGFLVGDGCLTGRGITFTCGDPTLVPEVMRLTLPLGGEVVPSDETGMRFRVRGIEPSPRRFELLRLLHEMGLQGHGAASKTVPDEIMAGGQSAWAGFLAGLLDTDGSVSVGRQPSVRFVNTSRDLLVRSQQLLAFLGVQSSLDERHETRRETYLPTWELRIAGRLQVATFASLVRSRGVKAERLLALVDVRAPRKLASEKTQARMFEFDRLKSLTVLPEAPSWGLTVEGGTHVTNGLVTHNTDTQKNIYTVQALNLRKRLVPRHRGISGGQQFSISTAGNDLDSLLGILYLLGIKVSTGEVVDPTLLFLWWEAPKALGEDLNDPVQRRGVILLADPSIGHWKTTAQVEAGFTDATLERHDVERRSLNRWVSHPHAWLTKEAWAACATPKGEPPAGVKVVLGFVGSYDRNTSALMGWTMPDQGAWSDYGFVIAKWEPDGKDPDWTVPREEVDAALYAAMKRLTVVEVACNPIGWVSEIQAWEREFGVRALAPDDKTKGRGIVLKFEMAVNARMGPACDSFKAAVLGLKIDDVPTPLLHHSGDEALARHIKNAHRRGTRYGAVIVQDKEESPRQITLAQASVIARRRAHQQPKPRKPGIAASF